MHPVYNCTKQWPATRKVVLASVHDLVTTMHSPDIVREPVTLLTRSEVEAIVRKEKLLPRQFPTNSCHHIVA